MSRASVNCVPMFSFSKLCCRSSRPVEGLTSPFLAPESVQIIVDFLCLVVEVERFANAAKVARPRAKIPMLINDIVSPLPVEKACIFVRILIQMYQICGQIFRRGKITDVDERIGRSQAFVVATRGAEDHRYRSKQNFKLSMAK